MAKLADALPWGGSAARRGGSSPLLGTITDKIKPRGGSLRYDIQGISSLLGTRKQQKYSVGVFFLFSCCLEESKTGRRVALTQTLAMTACIFYVYIFRGIRYLQKIEYSIQTTIEVEYFYENAFSHFSVFPYHCFMNKYIVPGRGTHIPHTNYFMSWVALFSSYICLFPLVIMDVFLWQFQRIYFRIMEIPCIERSKYIIIDRYKLTKLTKWQKINCVYCWYANGVVGYLKAVVNQMELYSCAIKHDHHPLGQEHQKDFFERKDFE